MWGGGGAAVIYAPNPVVHARSGSIRSASSDPPAYKLESKPSLPPITSDVTGESVSAGSTSTSTSPIQPASPALSPLTQQFALRPPIRAMSLNSIHSDSTSPPSFSAAAGTSAPDFESVFGGVQ
ncbi:hypothetical protein VKT23_000035 [Stygiomarasmius scandens]|uniref:Uncharacterized protein n=1 Tax=Marasmiellus scandens TaxID=2682957 RepID=A0ABR1K2Z5_9AGAR